MARRTATRAHIPDGTPGPIVIPQGPIPGTAFTPRSYQLPALVAWEPVERGGGGITRLVLVWPRRHGKDLTALAITQKGMRRRAGLYWHMYPTLKRGRQSMWDGKDYNGVPFRNRFPTAWIAENPNGPGGLAINDTEMKIDFTPLPGQPSGCSWQVVGGDDPDNLAGPNVVGVVFSEFQSHNPKCWFKIVQPMLAENGGWAVFDFTPEGDNHAHKLFQTAKRNPRWFAQHVTVASTRRDAPGEDGSPVIPEYDDPAHPERESIASMRRDGTPEEDLQSQYYCSFKGSVRGAIFGDWVQRAETEGRVGLVPWDPLEPVGTAWDIGRDKTAIWFWQEAGLGVHFIDYEEASGQGLECWLAYLTGGIWTGKGAPKAPKPYRYGAHLFPHDMAVTEYSSTESRIAKARQILRARCEVAEKTDLDDSHEAVRLAFRRFRFDRFRCADGLETLRNYKFGWDDDKQCFARTPVHNWASHGASALRTFVAGYRPGLLLPRERATRRAAYNTVSVDPQALLTPSRGDR